MRIYGQERCLCTCSYVYSHINEKDGLATAKEKGVGAQDSE